jgi:hypothetical protein
MPRFALEPIDYEAIITKKIREDMDKALVKFGKTVDDTNMLPMLTNTLKKILNDHVEAGIIIPVGARKKQHGPSRARDTRKAKSRFTSRRCT